MQTTIFMRTVEKGVVVLKEGKGKWGKEGEGGVNGKDMREGRKRGKKGKWHE